MKTIQEWKKYHQLSLSILKQFGFGVKSMMESRILTEVEFVTDHILKQNGKSIDPRELMHHCLTNIIMNIIFGHRQDYNLGITELGYQMTRFAEIVDVAIDVAPILRFVPLYRNKLRLLVENQKLIHRILKLETEKSLRDGADD